MDGVFNDLRHSARSLARTPAWTLMLVLTIALGVGSNAAVDGFITGLLTKYAVEAGGDPALTDAERAAGILRIGWLLRVAAIAVFAIACANVAAFLLSRASARGRETAVRVAIGAGRGQLLRQVLADSLVLSIAGAAAGALFAMWTTQIIPLFLFDQDAEQMLFAADAWRITLIAAVCAVITIVCGLLPVIEARHDAPGNILKREGAGPSRVSVRLGAGLVVVQMAACTMLVISAGLLVAGFQAALRTTAGSRLSDPAIASVDALQASSKTHEMTSGLRYFDAIERAAREVAGATATTWVSTVPGNRPIWQSFAFEGPGLPLRAVEFAPVIYAPRTLDSLVMPPIEGRMFGVSDTGACGAVVLSREAAKLVDGNHVVGRAIETPTGEWAEVIGVVATREGVNAPPRIYHYAPGSEEPTQEPETHATYRIPETGPARRPVLEVTVVTPNYFNFMGLPLLEGQAFTASTDACRVAIVNKEAAEQYFPDGAVGGAIIDGLGRRLSIIGVVGSSLLRVSQRAIPPAVYVPLTQAFQPRMTMIMETSGVDRATLDRLHQRIASTPGGWENRIIVATLDAHLSRTALAPERIATLLVGASAIVALILGMLGLYGVMADAARRRQREFALRIALGAQGGHVIGQVVAEGMRLVGIGTVVGMLGSLLVAGRLAEVTPTVSALSPWIWLAAPAILTIAVMVASVLPAQKALSADPLTIMRVE